MAHKQSLSAINSLETYHQFILAYGSLQSLLKSASFDDAVNWILSNARWVSDTISKVIIQEFHVPTNGFLIAVFFHDLGYGTQFQVLPDAEIYQVLCRHPNVTDHFLIQG